MVRKGNPVWKEQSITRDVKVRWTPALVQEGFTPVSTYFLDNYTELGITGLEAMFILHLIRFKWDQRNPYPSFEIMAARIGSSYSAARAQARSLERKGLLRRVRRRGYVEFDLTPLFRCLEDHRNERRVA